MFDFNDVTMANTDQRIRAWSVEQAIDFIGVEVPCEQVITFAKMIEDYVTNGDVTGVIHAAVEEGLSEGRFEVKEAAEAWFSNIDLDDLFKSRGWIDEKGKVNPEPEVTSFDRRDT